MAARTGQRRQLTLKDRLSRLTFSQACKLIGADGAGLIQQGGRYEIDLEGDVHLGSDLFRQPSPTHRH